MSPSVCISALLVCLLPFCLGTAEKAEHGAARHHSLYHHRDGTHNPVFDQEALLAELNRRRSFNFNGTSEQTGSSDMAEELEDLPDDVRERRLKNLAQSHDENKNDIIEPEELKKWIIQSFTIVDREEAAERMAEDDSDKDGKVTLAEIFEKQYGYSEKEVEELESNIQEDSEEENKEAMEIIDVIKEDKKKFHAADQDNDGGLDSKEFQAFFLPHNYPHMYDIEMERTMKDMDKNNDGSITMDEFIMNDEADEEQKVVEQQQFEDLDKDKDGKLSIKELKPWALADNEQIAAEEVEHLMESCDEDTNGKLTIDEVVKKADEFVTSSATDYGRVLHFVKDEL